MWAGNVAFSSVPPLVKSRQFKIHTTTIFSSDTFIVVVNIIQTAV